jgi:hypothetical protein
MGDFTLAVASLTEIGSTLTLINDTLENNMSNLGVADLKGTILAGNPSSGNCISSFFSTLPLTDQGYNISEDDSCGFSAVGSLNNTDPMLDPDGLANNGGPTETIALVSGSPAIDAIPLASCTDQDGNPFTTDQRGFLRPDAREAVCDIGAYEFQDFVGDPSTSRCYIKSISALSKPKFLDLPAQAATLI